MTSTIVTSSNNSVSGWHVEGAYATTKEALEVARSRFVARNPISLQLHEEAVKSLPGGNTRSLLHTAPFPVFIKSGKGYQVTSEDGHVYTDFVGELTAGLFGHSQPLIQKSLIDAIQNTGLNLGGTTRLEAQHASLICKRFNLDLIRFTNSGTEANLHAIQGAKRFTGRSKVVVFSGGYHGACFGFYEEKPLENVVDKQDFIVAEYNNIEDAKAKIEGNAENVAAILVEGMQGSGPTLRGDSDFLKQVQESARKIGAVFILDEVMTSRLAPGGLQELEGLEPDLTSLGKYLGGGITFGAFGGRKDIMRVYDPRDGNALAHSGTFNNNTLGMVAGHAGLSQVYTPEVAIAFNATGDKFRESLEVLTKGTKMTVLGRGSLLGVHFLKDGKKQLKNNKERLDDNDLKELFWLEMMEEGFWTTKRGSISLMLGTPDSELNRFSQAVKTFLKKNQNLVQLPDSTN